MAPNRFRQGSLIRPAIVEPLSQCAGWDACPLTPVFGAECDLVAGQHPIARTVAGLFVGRGPFAVARLVVSVVIDAFNHQIRRALSHVCKKSLVVIKPSIADGYAAPSVPVESFVVGIATAVTHCGPHSVGSRAVMAARRPVRGDARGIHFAPQASATICSAMHKVVGSDDRRLPTRTSAQPLSVAVFDASKRDDGQSTENVGNQISNWGHSLCSFLRRAPALLAILFCGFGLSVASSAFTSLATLAAKSYSVRILSVLAGYRETLSDPHGLVVEISVDARPVMDKLFDVDGFNSSIDALIAKTLQFFPAHVSGGCIHTQILSQRYGFVEVAA